MCIRDSGYGALVVVEHLADCSHRASINPSPFRDVRTGAISDHVITSNARWCYVQNPPEGDGFDELLEADAAAHLVGSAHNFAGYAGYGGGGRHEPGPDLLTMPGPSGIKPQWVRPPGDFCGDTMHTWLAVTGNHLAERIDENGGTIGQ